MALGEQGFYNILDHHHDDAKDWVVVNWNLGNMCNYSCSYCPSILNDGSFGWNDLEVVKKFINRVSTHYAPRKVYFEFVHWQLRFIGHSWQHQETRGRTIVISVQVGVSCSTS